MKRLTLFIILGLCLLVSNQGNTATSVSQYGITWTFDGDYTVGQFANGDYWLLGPITITSITPGWDGEKHGSMINPDPIASGQQAYDSRISAFDSSLLVQPTVILNPNTSLISTISWIIGEPGCPPLNGGIPRPTLKTAAVLTVLDSIPPDNGATVFRPPYSGNNKPLYLTSSLRKDLLPNLPIVANTPNINNVAARFERVWLDHFSLITAWGAGMYASPSYNMPNYGRDYSRLVGDASLLLMLDEQELITQFGSNKDTLLIRLVQLGIDLYEVVENGGYWMANGGINSGRKWPILFAGLMLDHAGMKNIGAVSPTMTYQGFQEDAQTFYVTQEVVDLTNSPQWNPDDRPWCEVLPYAQGDIGLPDWGMRHAFSPSLDNKAWGACYRIGENTQPWVGYVLPVHIMGAKDLWNHDALFDYEDRYVEVHGAGTDFAGNMWTDYRADYGCIWTRYDHNDIYSNGYNPCKGGPTGLKGDLNKDGIVNIQDVQCCVNHISGTQDWGSAADMNGDGVMNEKDVEEIVKIILGGK